MTTTHVCREKREEAVKTSIRSIHLSYKKIALNMYKKQNPLTTNIKLENTNTNISMYACDSISFTH